jgi:hypothetical protein
LDNEIPKRQLKIRKFVNNWLFNPVFMTKPIASFLTFFFIVFYSTAQIPAVGYWNAHLNYSNGVAVASGGGIAYMASEMGLFSYDIQDGEIERLSKINGLSDIGFSHLAYNKTAKALLIIYNNSNLDILKNGKIYNLRDIRRSPIIGDKSIYGYAQQNEFVYLATGFGIVVIDLKKLELRSTYQFGENGQSIKTNALVVTNDSIFAATDRGIYQAAIRGGNLQDFNFWSKKNLNPDEQVSIKNMVFFDNKLFVIKNNLSHNKDSIFFIENNELIYFNKGIDEKIFSVNVLNNELYVANTHNVSAFDKNGNRKFYIADYYSGTLPQPKAIAMDDKGHRWIADATQGLIYTLDGVTTQVINTPNGPKSRTAYSLSAVQNEVWIAPGAKDGISKGMLNFEPVSFLKNNQWNSIVPSTLESGNMLDILQIALNPFNSNSKAYGASYIHGLAEFEDGKIINNFHAGNSPIEEDTNPWSTIQSAAFDKNNNLWMINQSGNAKIKVLKPDGTWKSIALPGISKTEQIGQIFVTKNNHKWVTLLQNTQKMRIVVYDDNSTLDILSDDRIKMIGTDAGNGAIPGLSVISIAEDLDGKIWLGTESGVAVIYNPGGVFSESNFDAQQIKIQHEGNVQILLENEAVTAIAVDGANRKWFGTDGGGVFLMSADGTQQLEAFNTNNSPLFSDVITSIAITDNGEVFIATEKGILSYRGTASKGGEKHGQVYAFPNPVRPEFEGLIAIKGLVKDADVKITDINGNLVYQTRAHGGQAVWNGLTLRGERSKTGVYLVFSSNNDGTETMVTKIMFVN